MPPQLMSDVATDGEVAGDVVVQKDITPSSSANTTATAPVDDDLETLRSNAAATSLLSSSTNTTTNDPVLLRMGEKVPKSTIAERERFLILKKGDEESACQGLEGVLAWRQKNEDMLNELLANHKDTIGDSFTTDDEDVNNWNICSALAVYEKYLEQYKEWELKQKQNPKKKVSMKHVIPEEMLGKPGVLPKIIRSYSKAETGGNCIAMNVVPAKIKMDVGLPGISQVTYARAVMKYIDRLSDPTDRDKIIILIECRKVKGAPNVSAARMIPLMKELAQLGEMMPQRLLRLYVAPLPKMFVYVLKQVQKWLDPDTNDKMVFVPGSDGYGATLPVDKMTAEKDFSAQFINLLESHHGM